MKNYFEGHCTCGHVHYKMMAKPLIVHCCHCTWCQRETGSAFVINALIESDNLLLTQGEIELVKTPTRSGRGQKIARCPVCRVALWSHYSSKKISFVRTSTLSTPNDFPPDIHIYTSTKQPWFNLPEGAQAVKGFYTVERIWSAQSLERVAGASNKKEKA